MRLAQRAGWLLASPWRLVVLVAVVAALPIVVAGELAAADTTARHEAAAADAARRTAASAAASFADRVSAISLAVTNAATRAVTGKTTPLIDALDRNDVKAAQLELEEMHRFIDPAATWLVVIDPHSLLVAVDPFATGLSGTDLSDGIAPSRGSAALEIGNAFPWNDVGGGGGPKGGGSGRTATSVAISVTTPIQTTRPLGYRLLAVLKLSVLAGPLISPLRSSFQDAYLVDRSGHLALRASRAFSPDDTAYRDLSGSPAVASLAPGAADPLSSDRVVRGAARVPDIGWSVLVVDAPTAIDADLEAALGQQRALRLGLAAVLLLGAALVGSASATAMRRRRETTEALEQQTATSDVLKTISQSAFDLHAVFDVVVENALSLCRGDFSYLFQREGDVFQIVASRGGTPELLAYEYAHPTPLRPDTLIGRVALERNVVHIPDLFEDPAYNWPSNRAAGVHTVLGVPIFKDDEVVGAIGVARNEKRPFSDAEIRLVRTFADQAAIAMENVRLYSETKRALERQTAISEILRVIASSPGDEKVVLDTIARSATRFCGADDAVVFLINEDHFDMAAHHGSVPLGRDRMPLSDVTPLSATRETLAGRALLERRTLTLTDTLGPEADPYPRAREAARLLGMRAVLTTPLIREDQPLGVIVLRKTEPVAFTTDQVSLIEAFAHQAVIAIENVRLFNETKEALERQTSISDVLQTIGRSAFDLQPVLDTVVERAVRLCDAHDGSISTLEDGAYRTRSYWSVGVLPAAYIEFMLQEVHRPERGSLVGRTALEGRVVQIADVLEDPEYAMVDMQQAAGYRTVLGVPLLRDGRVIGVFALTRNEVRPFTDRQIELVRTFADQAAIAIENTRLFAATKEALEQQTAVGEVLKTISRSAFDLQPVLDIVLNNAVRLAGADIGWLSRVENDQFTTVAYSTEFPESVREELVRQRAQGHIAGPWIPLGTGGGLMGFTLAEGHTVHLPDVKADPELKGSVVARLTESRTVVGVPMLREGRSIGGLVLARYDVRPFAEREIELVQTFADQAAIAIENVRLFSETKEALERQTAIGGVLRVISSSPTSLQPVLEAVVSSARRFCGAEDAAVALIEDGRLINKAHDGSVGFGTGSEIPLDRRSMSGRAVIDGKMLQVSDLQAASEEFPVGAALAREFGFRTAVVTPLLREGRPIGTLSLRRVEVRPFSETQIELLRSFADQAVIAIENVRLFNEIQDKSQQLEIASRHKSEFLANMSHELRTPLNAIIGFSDVLLEGLFGELNEKQREYLLDVRGSGDHLLSLINDILDLSKIEAGRMDLELSTFSFRDALDSGLTIVRERAARHAIQLNAVVAPDVGKLEADERKVKQILYNLLSNAVKFTPDGGRVDVSVRADNGDVRVEVRDTGIGVAAEDQERIFEEFRQVGRERAREGTGLGLTLTKRFVELHGGRIWLESTPGKGSTFTFTLPMRRAAAVRA